MIIPLSKQIKGVIMQWSDCTHMHIILIQIWLLYGYTSVMYEISNL